MAFITNNEKDQLRRMLVAAHPAWKENIKRWQFLIDSYYGGQDYREGKYLTAYMMESQEDYETRVDTTPYDNHVKAIVAIYNSFLFREPPERDWEELENDPALEGFLKDADFDGRSFDAVMKDVSTYATVYGHVWVIIDKPPVEATTMAEALANGIRPYLSIITPENVMDWRYKRELSGRYTLQYLKIYEGNESGVDVFRIYTPEKVQVFSLDREDAQLTSEFANPLGRIPAVCVYGQRSPIKGIGISDVGDVADMCRAIYCEQSEIEQVGRLTNHPSLVKTASTAAGAGAGSIIQLPEDLNPDLKPYLLQPNGGSLDGFLNSIKNKVESIDRMAHMGGIRSIETRRLSGIGLATEFQLLNARLAAKGDELEHAEMQIWSLYAQWQGVTWTGYVDYPNSFNIQDKYNDMNMLKLAKDSAPRSDVVHEVIEKQMLRILVDEDEYDELEEKVRVVTPMEETTGPTAGSSASETGGQTLGEDSSEEDSSQEEAALRLYPDGQPIPADLPPAYQSSASDGVPEGQACGNCEYNINQMCAKFNNAPIRESWWCLKWEPKA